MAGRCGGGFNEVRQVGGLGISKIHSMLKYNNIFVAQNLSGNVIAVMGKVY